MPPFPPPPGYARIKVVRTFEELVSTPFDDGVNGLCWSRDLPGDFREVAETLAINEGRATLDDERLHKLALSAAGRVAVGILIEDQRRLRDLGLSPVLDCIRDYPRDKEGAIPTDVYSFHVDSAPAKIDTYLCSYHGAASEALRNDEALRRVDVPETRTRLLEEFGRGDDDAFREYLKERSYDLHYVPIGEARPFSLGLGNLWRLAVDYPGSPVPPFIHRAPAGGPPRLLLIS